MISVRHPDHFIILDTPIGVRLACPGHFGGMPFATIADAEAEARSIAGDARISVQLLGLRRGRRK